MNDGLEGTIALNQKQKGHAIAFLQNVFLPKERPTSSTNDNIGVNVPEHSAFIDV